MSVFASETKSDPIPVPGDPEHWVRVRKLTGAEVEAAQTVHLRGTLNGRDWANRFRREIAKGIATDAQVQEALADPLLGYDRMTVARAGLIEWSYQHKGKMKPLAAVVDLDDERLDFVALEALKLTKPALFKTAEELEGDRKNG